MDWMLTIFRPIHMKPFKVAEKVGMTVDKIKYFTVVNGVVFC